LPGNAITLEVLVIMPGISAFRQVDIHKSQKAPGHGTNDTSFLIWYRLYSGRTMSLQHRLHKQTRRSSVWPLIRRPTFTVLRKSRLHGEREGLSQRFSSSLLC